jgi:hypothetical protein
VGQPQASIRGNCSPPDSWGRLAPRNDFDKRRRGRFKLWTLESLDKERRSAWFWRRRGRFRHCRGKSRFRRHVSANSKPSSAGLLLARSSTWPALNRQPASPPAECRMIWNGKPDRQQSHNRADQPFALTSANLGATTARNLASARQWLKLTVTR